jgi:methylthioribulose-1-phosphate dehydratase
MIMAAFQDCVNALSEVGRQLYSLGMVPATSGNFSMRMEDDRIAITVSGRHKGRLTAEDIMLIDFEGRSLDERRPSAEKHLHLQIYRRFPDVGAVLHPHSIYATLISRLQTEALELRDYELLKAFKGINTHQASMLVPIFGNDQDIERLAADIDAWMETGPPVYGYLIHGHGFYTWGETLDDAMRHIEALDYLLKCELILRGAGLQ